MFKMDLPFSLSRFMFGPRHLEETCYQRIGLSALELKYVDIIVFVTTLNILLLFMQYLGVPPN